MSVAAAKMAGDLPPTPSPPRTRHAKRGQTRFEKEMAANGGNDERPGDPKIIGPWRIGRTIGKGASGRVKIAKHSKTGQYAAIKIVPKHALLKTSRMSITDAGVKHDKAVLGIEREIVIMKLIDHPNVMSLYDVWETTKELYLVLEFVQGGELFDYLVSRGRLPPDEASGYFQQIVAGVDYCHRFNICHRDLKPENLLLDADKNIKIADFGMAALEPSDKMLETSCGSPHYASPEIVAGLSYHGSASDIWSCGVILFALLTGRLPFDDENIRVLLQKVKSGRFIMPNDLPSDAKDLITRMLVVDPEQRLTMPEILKHPFCQRNAGTTVKTEPPRLEEIARPVKSEREIDRDILRNLRTLWHGAPEREIVASLLSQEKTWEKAFYFLLMQYRNKHLENFNPEDNPQTERRKRREGSTHRSELKPTRVAPKSPATPSRRPTVVGPRPPSASPRTPAPPPNTKGATVELPKIILQEPTPQSPSPHGLGINIPQVSPSPSPRQSGPPSPIIVSGDPVGIGNIAVPQVQDAALQKFFHDIAEQLQLISGSPRNSLVVDGGAFPNNENRTSYQPPSAAAQTVRPGETRRRSYLGDITSRDNTIQPVKQRNTMDSKRKSKPAPLNLSPQLLQHDAFLIPGSPTPSSAPPSPLLVTSPSEIKQSWFSNLFSWKPAMFTLITADDCVSSRTECVKLLESFGAHVMIEDADGWGILKCRIEEIRDTNGIIIPKSVRFRIEFLPHAAWSSGPPMASPRLDSAASPRIGSTTSITMVQEKGALSAFKAVYRRIRSEWRLESLRSPAMTAGSKFTSPAASPLLSDHGHVWA